jgi:hypothetical protein
MRVVRRARERTMLLCVLLLALVLLGVACGGSSTATTVATAVTVPLPAPADADTIAANFVKFFDGTQPATDKAGLLENGEQHTSEIQTQAASSVGKTLSVAISSITSSSSTTAEVKFSILVGDKPAFADQTGKAVLQDGVWKVAAETFQAVLVLEQGFTTPSS